MSTRRENLAIIGLGAAACTVCCAGPILGFLAAIGLGTVAGVLMFGAVGLVVGVLGVAVVLRRRHRQIAARSDACGSVDVAMSTVPSRG